MGFKATEPTGAQRVRDGFYLNVVGFKVKNGSPVTGHFSGFYLNVVGFKAKFVWLLPTDLFRVLSERSGI